MEKIVHQTAILGAGLAGLGAAYESDFPVFEKKKTPGGTAASVRNSGYVFDYGIHVIHSKDPSFHELMKTVGAQFVSHQRRGLIYSHGSYAAYPFQINTSHLPVRIRLQCVLGYLFKKNIEPITNYEEWILQNFGNGFGRQFLIPYSEKFWCIHPSEMTPEWTGEQRVPMPKISDVVKGAFFDQKGAYGPNSEFIYPSGAGIGFGGIPEAIAAHVKHLHCNMTATSVDLRNKTVEFNGGDALLSYENLIWTIPLPELPRLIKDLPQDVKAAVDKLRYNSIAVVNLGFNRPKLSDNHWIHFPDEEISFFRISFPGNFALGLNPETASTIQAEVAYFGDCPLETDHLISKVHQDLISVGIVESSDELIFKEVLHQKYGYVIYDKDHSNSCKVIHDYLLEHNVHCCGRYGEWAYLWADQAVKSGRQTACEILKKKPGQVNE